MIDPVADLVSETLLLAVPPRDLDLVEFIREHGYLSPENCAEPGRFRPYPYQLEILTAMSDPSPECQTLVFMKSSRVGYSASADHCLAYYLAHDPSPCLVVLPTLENAADYSKNEIGPLIRDIPLLRQLALDSAPRQKASKRMFGNGASAAFVGAVSGAGLARLTIRVLIIDELDRFPLSTREGDVFRLASRRTETFSRNKKILVGSTPLLEGESRIQSLFEQSDQRYYNIPCPSCGEMNVLKFSNLRWDRGPEPERRHLCESAHFICSSNGCIIPESAKQGMIEDGIWIATHPENKLRGYHIWTAYSPHMTWAEIAQGWADSYKNPQERKVFTNTVLGLPYSEEIAAVPASILLSRVENYNRDSLPAGVKFIVSGVDVQEDRLEMSSIAFSERDEAWYCSHEVFHGSPSMKQVWIEMDAAIRAPFFTEDGRTLFIQASCLDTGGHFSQQVVDFCQHRPGRRLWPTKGIGGGKTLWPLARSKSKHGKIFLLGVDHGKDLLASRLKITPGEQGSIHFPLTEEFNEEFFSQLTSETFHTDFRLNRPVRKWVLKRGVRNEALDCFVLCFAAKLSLKGRYAMLAPPPKAAAKPTSEFNIDISESATIITPDFTPQPMKKRRGLASRIAGFNQSGQQPYNVGVYSR
jgi:terminase, large subunit